MIYAGRGFDMLLDAEGSDTFFGGRGFDVFVPGPGGDVAFGGPGDSDLLGYGNEFAMPLSSTSVSTSLAPA